jgi:hypothetical protein
LQAHNRAGFATAAAVRVAGAGRLHRKRDGAAGHVLTCRRQIQDPGKERHGCIGEEVVLSKK